MNLRKKMLLFITLPVLIAFIFVGTSSYMYSKKLLKSDNSEILSLTSDKYSLDIEADLSYEKGILEFIVNYMTYHKVPTNEMKKELAMISASYNGKEMFIGLPDGRFLDPRGKIGERDLDVTTRPWYTNALGKNETVAGSPYYNVEGDLVASLSKEIKYNNELKAIVLTNVNLDALLKFVKETVIEKTGQILILDRDGIVVASKNHETGVNLREVDNGELVPVVDMLTTTDKEFFEFNLRGKKMYAAVDDLHGTNWRLITMVPEEEVVAGVKTLLYFTIGAVFGGVIILMVLIMVISNGISKSADKLAAELGEMANYDLSLSDDKATRIYAKSKDEMGMMARSLLNFKHTIQEMMGTINDLSSQVSASSQQLTASSEQSAHASEEIARAVDDISRGAMTQAEDVLKGTGAMNRVGDALIKNDEILSSLTSTAQLIEQAKDKGMVSVNELVRATAESKEGAMSINRVIIETNEASQHIQQYTDMIKSIADQTNLLALNASIEAARAGEQGRGFAVVADEIKKLAEQTTDFTKEIDAKVAELTSKTRGAVETMAEVGKIVANQSQKVEETKEQFDIIAEQVVVASVDVGALNESKAALDSAKSELQSILASLQSLSEQNAASAEQSSASVQEQTATAEEIASASHNLSEMAQDMSSMIAKFKL